MMYHGYLLLLLTLLLSFETANGELRLPTFIASHMVLQREPLRAVLWGWAEPLSNISIYVNQHLMGSAVTLHDGSWRLKLDQPLKASGQNTVQIISDRNETITLENVAFGDVYLCSGQSNMEFPVSHAFNATEEVADSVHYPNLALATVARVTADTPKSDVPSKTTSYIWARSSPSTVDADGVGEWGVYSATCYFFGRDLYMAQNGKVPIGLITASWGGQRIETFSSPDALNDTTCGGTRQIFGVSSNSEVSRSLRGKVEIIEKDSPQPTQLWNAMIHPLLPMRFSGAVWYQGEANSKEPEDYACQFPAMIIDWRRKFGLWNLTFAYVELAGHDKGGTWPSARAAQAAALQLPGVGFATAIDLSDPTSPDGGIHPRRKQEVGRRLALQIRSLHYREREGLVSSGPKLANVEFLPFKSRNWTIMLLGFSAGTADGLHLHGTGACDTCCEEAPFHVLDRSGNWHRVVHATVREELVLLATHVRKVHGIRYAWEARPQCALYNGVGGPDDHSGIAAAPFEWCLTQGGRPAPSWTGKACLVD